MPRVCRRSYQFVMASLHGYLDAQEEYFVVFLVRSISPRSGSGSVGQKKKRNACVYVCARIREHTLPDMYYEPLAATRDPSILREKSRKKKRKKKRNETTISSRIFVTDRTNLSNPLGLVSVSLRQWARRARVCTILRLYCSNPRTRNNVCYGNGRRLALGVWEAGVAATQPHFRTVWESSMWQ